VWLSVSGGKTIVGQIHPTSGLGHYPLLKCLYANGSLDCKLERHIVTGGDFRSAHFTGLPQNTPFFYRIAYITRNSDTRVCVWAGANPAAAMAGPLQCQRPTESFLNPKILQYFKVGNYNQGQDKAIVRIHYMKAWHSNN
jgi:hypothetical protein